MAAGRGAAAACTIVRGGITHNLRADIVNGPHGSGLTPEPSVVVPGMAAGLEVPSCAEGG